MSSVCTAAKDRRSSLHLPRPRLVESSFSAFSHTVSVLTDEALFESCGTRIAFTSRAGGESFAPFASLNLATHVGDDPSAVHGNRRILLECLGGPAGMAPIVPNQVHGTEIVTVADVHSAERSAERGADGIACALDSVPVLLCFADCVPVIIVAPSGAFCIVHAGWRGALGGIPGAGLKALCSLAACDAASCNVYIGPHIGPCCYEVSAELLGRFTERFGSGSEAFGKLDLSFSVVASLVGAGASADRIEDVGICTSCNTDRYYSYRAEGGVCGRHGAYACKGESRWD